MELRVIEIAPLYKWASGPVTVLCGVVEQLVKKGIEISIYSPENHNSELAGVFADLGVEVFSDYHRLCLELRRCHLVHFHGAFNLRFVPISRECKRSQTRYLISPHGNLMPGALAYHRLRKQVARCTILRPYLEGAIGYHALTVEERDAIYRLYPRAKVTVIPNGIKPFKESIGKSVGYEADDDVRIIGFLGRIDIRHKGLDLLLEAVSRVSDELHGYNTKVLIAGPFKNASDERTFRRLLVGDGSGVVQYVGPQYGADKDRFLKKCDVFIHTSRCEGMPMAVLEAMARGIPSVVTEETNMGDVLRSAKAGLVCSGSVESIAEGLLEVCRMEKAKLQQMGENAKRWVIENLAWSAVADRYLEMYNDYTGN